MIGTPLHPRALTLSRFADATLGPRARRRVAAHIARCPRCRDLVATQGALVAAAAALRADAPPADGLARVLASRAAGARVLLPTAESAPERRRVTAAAWWGLVAAALVLAAVALGPASFGRPAAEPPAGDAPASPASALFGSLAPGALHAQGTGRAARPAAPPAIATVAARLRATSLGYERRVVAADGRAAQADGRGTLAIEAVRVDGHDAWRAVHSWRTPRGEESETLYVARADLRPLGRTVHVRPYLRFREITIRQRFSGDSVVGWMHTGEGLGRPIARRTPRAFAPYTTDGFAPLFLAGVPLRAGWTGSISLLGWAVRDGDLFVPVTLRVIGEERVRVPAGEFECWALAIDTPGRTMRYWVRKSDGVGVRGLRTDGGRTHEIVLAR